MATVIIGLILLLVVVTIVRKMYRDHKAGKGSCGCGCENCGHKNNCH